MKPFILEGHSLAEIIDDDETGLLVPNRKVDAMAKAMLQLALDKKKRERMGAKARDVVKEKFSVEKTSFRLKEIYEQVLKQK